MRTWTNPYYVKAFAAFWADLEWKEYFWDTASDCIEDYTVFSFTSSNNVIRYISADWNTSTNGILHYR
jgi:hypothetical protein